MKTRPSAVGSRVTVTPVSFLKNRSSCCCSATSSLPRAPVCIQRDHWVVGRLYVHQTSRTIVSKGLTVCATQDTMQGDGDNTAGNSEWRASIPTALTLARVVAIPALVACWYANLWMWCWGLFVGASVTDFLDGYLARAWNCSTPFGAFLDPVADKLMVATILILIGTVPIPSGYFAGNTWILPVAACIIIAREITMSALREWGATLGPEAHSAVAVNALGKYKTSCQMVSLVLLLGAKIPECSSVAGTMTDWGMGLLGVATWLTVSSVVSYFKGLWKFMF